MEIIMKQDEIEKALKDYVGTTGLGIDLSGRDINIDLKAGRGENGHTAHIEIIPIVKAVEESPDATDPDEDDQGIKFEFEDDN